MGMSKGMRATAAGFAVIIGVITVVVVARGGWGSRSATSLEQADAGLIAQQAMTSQSATTLPKMREFLLSVSICTLPEGGWMIDEICRTEIFEEPDSVFAVVPAAKILHAHVAQATSSPAVEEKAAATKLGEEKQVPRPRSVVEDHISSARTSQCFGHMLSHDPTCSEIISPALSCHLSRLTTRVLTVAKKSEADENDNARRRIM